MKWRGRRASTNVDDARGRRTVGGGAGIGAILNLVLRIFGFKGLLVLGVVGLIGWQMGLLNPAALMGGSQVQEVGYEASAEEEELLQFVKVVLADTEDIWTNEFGRVGRQYQEPGLVVFRERYPTACGTGDARMGPFYCPADKKIYIDLGFYEDLERQFEAPGDFAQAYVIAHEVGHHVQTLLGISKQVRSAQRGLGKADANALSVRQELQADCFAGLWGNHADRSRQVLEQGDIEEALNAAAAIGDDRLQKQGQGYVVPESFTHGSSEQRVEWFRKGIENGDFSSCDTFGS